MPKLVVLLLVTVKLHLIAEPDLLQSFHKKVRPFASCGDVNKVVDGVGVGVDGVGVGVDGVGVGVDAMGIGVGGVGAGELDGVGVGDRSGCGVDVKI